MDLSQEVYHFFLDDDAESVQVCVGVQESCSGILIQVAQVPDGGETTWFSYFLARL